jgi:dGTP triphosphohydrolase
MTFSVNGIKQEKTGKYTVEMLVCVDAPLLARKILEKMNILILSVKEFPKDKKTFGDIYFTIKQNFQDIDIVTKYVDIQEACNFFTLIGFDIRGINSFSKPLSKKEVDNIIATSQAEAKKKKEEQEEKTKEIEESEKKVYADADLESAKKIISRVFEKIDETMKRSAGKISLQESKQIKSLTEELKKLRMGTNFEKIRTTIQELFKMIEKINDAYYASIQNPEATISDESLITNVDVEKELERMENVKILKSL